MAAAVSLPNTLTNGQPNDAAQVMADLNALVTWINTNAAHLDASKAFTGVVTGPATDPTTANQYTRKAWVDAQIAAEVATRAAADIDPRRSGATAARVASQAVAGATPTFLTFDTEVWDSDAYFPPPSTSITIPTGKAGVFMVTFYASVSDNTIILRSDLVLNGVTVLMSAGTAGSIDGVNNTATGSGMFLLNATDALQIKVWHSAGVNKNFIGRLSVARISA